MTKGFILLIYFFPTVILGQNYGLKGVFKVKYARTNNYPKSFIAIFDSSYISKVGNIEVYGKSFRVSNGKTTTIYLLPNQPKTQNSDIDKLITNSFGREVIEFQESTKRKIKFRTTYLGQLHITHNVGKLIRYNDKLILYRFQPYTNLLKKCKPLLGKLKE